VLAIVFLAAVFAFPLYWVVTMSFKPLPEWNPPGKVYWFPENPTLENYEKILGIGSTEGETVFATSRSRSALGYLQNSAVASVGGTLLALVVGIFVAYGIARFRAGGRMLPFQILQLRMFPPIAIVIPLLFMFVQIGLWNKYFFGWLPLGLIIIYGAITFPFVVWLMRSFFQEVPREISEAAIVDGCTQWGAFFKAVLPQVKGGLAATALFVFILNWSDFLIAKVMTQDTGNTAPVYLQSLQGGAAGNEYGLQAALAMILIIPPAVFGLLIQRYLVRGLTFGAIKR
jgi:multiple sugar transport system permease protein